MHVQIMDRITAANGRQLPWEEESGRAHFRHRLGLFRNDLLALVARDPAARPSMRQFSAACAGLLSDGTVEQL